GDVGGVLPVVAEGGLRELGGGGAVREGDGSKGGVAYGSVVKLEHRAVRERAGVERGERHKEVVRVLRVDERAAVGGLAGLEEERVPLAGDGDGFQAEHGLQHEAAASDAMLGREHEGVGGEELVEAARSALLGID